MSDWQKVGENLQRHVGGTIYLRAKVKGKVIRVSLGTKDLRIAKLKRDSKLAVFRAEALVKNPQGGNLRTIREALAVLRAEVLAQPHLKVPTRDYYTHIFKILGETLPVDYLGRTWTKGEAARWWQDIAGKHSPILANNILSMMRKLAALFIESGMRTDDPTRDLKRVTVPENHFHIPSLEEVQAIVASVRSQGKARSAEAADFIEFLAMAGCRKGQLIALEWEHVGEEWITFQGGISGTKGAATRKFPLTRHLADLIARMRKPGATGKVFKIKDVRGALNGATERLGMPHVRIHDLRHAFSTYAVERGVDVPTVASWLGHKDGGKLLLKTYNHLRDAHSKESAKKL